MKKNKLTYALIFALTFIGFIGGVNASCCYQTADGKYTYISSMPSNECAKQKNYSTSLSEAQCKAKNNETNKFCCDVTNGTNSGKPQSLCNTPTTSWTDEAGCATAYDNQYHQCCNNEGKIIENASKNDCIKTENASRGYQWRTVYQCASLKKVCCVNGQENPSYNSQSTCEGYASSSGTQAVWQNKAQCAGLTESSTRDTINHVDLTNPYVTPSTGKDTDWGNGGDPTDSTSYMEIDLGCEGMKELLGLIKIAYNLIRYATPVVLVILGSIDFMKAVMAGKEDDIKKNQKRFVSRLILAVGVFLLLSVFELITNILDRSNVSDSKAWYNCWTSLMIMFK